MNCLRCGAENLRDLPVCRNCESSCHFNHRQDCQCPTCQAKRAEAAQREYQRLAEIAHTEELQYTVGRSFAAA